MAQLTTRTAKINVVISLKSVKNVGVILDNLKRYCDDYMQLYAYILHDKDILDDGTLKTPHIHLVGLLKHNTSRLCTTINNIDDYIHTGTLAITIDKMSDIVGSIQYLVHKNDTNKYQYPFENIVSNISIGELNTYMNSDARCMSIEYLIDIVEHTRSRIEIMRKIGLSNYHQYRNVINDIYNEIWTNSY